MGSTQPVKFEQQTFHPLQDLTNSNVAVVVVVVFSCTLSLMPLTIL